LAVLSLDSVIAVPPAGAAALIVTVPVAPVPPITDAGATVSPVSVIGCAVIVSVVETVVPVSVPFKVEEVSAGTMTVPTANAAEVV